MRLQKFMAEAGVASRRKSEELIAAGRVRVNGNTAEIGMSVEEDDAVEVDGKRIRRDSTRVVLMLNKPAGVVCSSSDPEGRETVLDIFKDYPHRLYNVGRLDYDSEGLIIMTNDGELAYRLMHPKFVIGKTYYAVCSGGLTQEEALKLRNGVELEDGRTAPAKLRDVYHMKNGNTSLFLTIHEGRNRQVRRMLAAVGHDTLLLRRVALGPLQLGELKPGCWRELTEAELMAIDAILK